VTHQAIIREQARATLERVQGEARVLLVQDTTTFDFSHHPGTEGLGTLENAHCWGFLAHTTLAVSAAGVPLGVLAQQVWVRHETSKRGRRHESAFAEKESYKWVTGVPEGLTEEAQTQWVTVCDREAHIYAFFDAMHARGMDYIVRATRERSFTPDGREVWALVADLPVQARYTLMLQRRPDRAARSAQVALRFSQVTVKRPKRANTAQAVLTLSVVAVIEPDPPAGEAAVHWLLLTSLPVATVAQAQQIVTWYTYRWLVERLHFVLKSGCRLEARQLRDAVRLERLLAVYSLVAWKLLWLTYQARQTPDAPCTVALQPHEWHALYAFIHHAPRLPPTPPTLRQVTRWIAQLGGFLGRKGDGEPGVKVLWRGWTRLQDIAATWSISHPQDVGNV
jgi:hypothetical protein